MAGRIDGKSVIDPIGGCVGGGGSRIEGNLLKRFLRFRSICWHHSDSQLRERLQVEARILRLSFILPGLCAPLEHLHQLLACLALTLAHLVRMHSALRCDLPHGAVPAQRIFRDLRLEGRRCVRRFAMLTPFNPGEVYLGVLSQKSPITSPQPYSKMSSSTTAESISV